MVEYTPQPAPRTAPDKEEIILWAALCIAVVAIIAAGVLAWQLLDTHQDLTDLKDAVDRHTAAETDITTLESDVSAQKTATTIPVPRSCGPLTVACVSSGGQCFSVNVPMSRVVFSFTADGTPVSWWLDDMHFNRMIDKSYAEVWGGGGSFIAAEAGNHYITFSSSSAAVVTVNYIVYAPAPVVAGS